MKMRRITFSARASINLLVGIWLFTIAPLASADMLYEGFDAPVGTLHNQAGATSYGFHPTLGDVWKVTTGYGAPNVGAGSIVAPAFTSSYYDAMPIGNRAVQGFQTTAITRNSQVSGTHLYGTHLATMGLNGFFYTNSVINFGNFKIFAINPGSNSTAATWVVETVGNVNTGLNAQGTTLVSWDLEFDQGFPGNHDTLRIWFNKNPLTDAPDYFNSNIDLGQNQMGGINLTNNIFLGLSIAEYDEIRVGSSWDAVGITSVPEPSCQLAILLGLMLPLRSRRRSRSISSPMQTV
jgi:hypothetical protein